MAKLAPRLGAARYEADEFYKKALAAYQKRNTQDALSSINDAIAVLPTNAEYYAARGLMYLDDGRDREAAADFEAALKLFPYELLAHYGRGIIAFNNKQWDEALNHFTTAYRVDPQRPETLYYLALVYHRQNQNDAAMKVMQMAHDAFNPDDPINGKENAKRRSDANKWINTFKKMLLPSGG